jgi:hypothetical protein
MWKRLAVTAITAGTRKTAHPLLNLLRAPNRGRIVAAITSTLLGGAGSANGRSEFLEKFRILQESPPSFRCS